jgi:hypothetical protein
MRFDDHEPKTKLLADESLEVRFRPPFENTLRITSWRDGLRVLRNEPFGWVEVDRDPQLAFVGSAWRSLEASAAHTFARTIPAEAVALAAAAGTFELTALRALRWHEAAWDLARSCPNLMWLLSAHIDERALPNAELGELLRRRRREILSWCVNKKVATAAVRLLEKVVPELQSDREIKMMTRAVADADLVELFRHFKRVSLNTLHAAISYPALRRRRFFVDALAHDAAAFEEEGASSSILEACALYADALRTAHQLRIPQFEAKRTIDGARTVARLRAQHDQWSDELTARVRREFRTKAHQKAPARFPAAPVPDAENIVAIRTFEELVEEGTAMRHCAVTYVDECAAGRSFLYRVLAPTRATLELRMNGSTLCVAQLRGVRNARVPDDTWEEVGRWLTRSGR